MVSCRQLKPPGQAYREGSGHGSISEQVVLTPELYPFLLIVPADSCLREVLFRRHRVRTTFTRGANVSWAVSVCDPRAGTGLPPSILQIAGNEVLLWHDLRDEDEEWQARWGFHAAPVLCGIIFVVVVSRQGEEWYSEKDTHPCSQKLCWCGSVDTFRPSAV